MKLTSPYLRNVIRTFAPAVIGGVASWIAAKTANINPTVIAITGVSTTTIYYAIIRYIETKYPKVGLLLGAKKEASVPVISATATATVSPTVQAGEPSKPVA